MNLTNKIALVAAVSTLAACSSNSTAVPSAVQPVLTSAMLPGTLYAPVAYDGETNAVLEMVGDGIPGFIGNSDGTVSQALVRLSADRTVAYLSIDGGPEQEFSTRSGYYEDYPNYLYGTFSDGETSFYVSASNYSNGYGSLNASSGYNYIGNGTIGLETALADLPTGVADYIGNFSMSGDTASAGGTMHLNLDFANSSIDGLFISSYYAFNEIEEIGNSGAMSGQIAGSIDGGRIAGTAATTTGPEGSFDFMGAVYGDEAQYAAGGIGGTLTVDDTDHTMGGGFYLSSDGYYYHYR
jgi:hypothetical protein